VTPLPPEGSVPAVVTAGGRIDGAFAVKTGVEVKALCRLPDGRRLIDVVLGALRETPFVGRIVVVGPLADLADVALPANTTLIAEAATGPENVQRGIQAVADGGELPERLLLCTSDLPFVSAESLTQLAGMAPADAEIVYPVAERAVYEAAHRGSPNTFAKLAGREYTGGGAFLIDPRAIVANADLIAAVFHARKSQIGMARLLGLPSVLRFLTGRLTVAQAERRVTELIGCRCRALVGAPVELCADIDSLADYDWVLSRSG